MQEIFKDIPGYEGLYQVSNYGKVKSLVRRGCVKDRILKPAISSGGYYTVSLYKEKPKKYAIHQLVAISFLNHIPCGYKLVIDHIDFNRTNNKLLNLKLISVRENTNKKHLKSSSKYCGVSWNTKHKKWYVYISINDINKYLGVFTNELEASKVYQKALKNLNK